MATATLQQQERIDPAEPSVGCPARMTGDQPCHRLIHNAAGIDAKALCLMHSRDPNKDNKIFQVEIENILRKAEAGDGIADFRGFVFMEAGFRGRTFKASCIFSGATFTQDAQFRGATFTKDAHFREATFTQAADFRGATFTQVAHFSEATFTQVANFREATLAQDANFSRTTFTRDAHFRGARFMQDARFPGARFMQDTDFSETTFTRDADFTGVTFTQDANFSEAKLNQVANFSEAKFRDVSRFRKTRFRGDPELLADSDTRDSSATRDEARLPGPIFTRTKFEKPENVEFYQTYLGQALLHNCDVSRLSFSDVTWRRRRRGSGKLMIFDEEIELGAGDRETATEKNSDYLCLVTEALRPGHGDPNDRNYRLIAETYQQLKKNYDERRDYWTAGDFYYGEMEMSRLDSPQRIRVFRWCHRNLGLVAWYKYASAYGGSYLRPAAMLFIVLAIFSLLFPWAGLDRLENPPNSVTAVAAQTTPPSAATSELSYKHFIEFVRVYPGRKWVAPAAFFGESLMTALSVSPFQKVLKYQPSYPWGQLLAVLELLLTYTLITLFLLAVRRQFKR